MECAEARLFLSQQLDEQLPAAEAVDLTEHLAGCGACQALARDLAVEQEQLRALWSPGAVPVGFAERVLAALPERRPRAAQSRRFVLAAALALVIMTGLLAVPSVRAALGLALQRVVLREVATPATGPQTLPLKQRTLAEAQQLVPWRIRQPDPLPAGYALVSVYSIDVYTFATGPTIVLEYRAAGSAVGQLRIEQFQSAARLPAPADVAPGAARTVAVGARTGLLIDGRWVVGPDGRSVWERGTLLRLLIEEGDIVIQVVADPREGWDTERLVAVAATLR